MVSTPTRFKSFPLAETTSILLERRMEKTSILRKRIAKLIEKQHTKRKGEQLTNYRFEIIPKQAPWFRSNELRLESFKKFDLMTSLKRFSSRIIYDQDVFIRAAKKGVRIRILTQKPKHDSSIIPIISNLRGYPNFEIRFLRTFSDVVLIIMDQKETALALCPTNHVGPPYLFSNHPSFVLMAQQHFELKWGESSELELPF